jgi:hypothetical protein
MDPKLQAFLDASRRRADFARISANEAHERGVERRAYARGAEAKLLARPPINVGPQPMKVVAATFNPTEPWGIRPYHRPDCSYVTKSSHVEGYWRDYDSAAEAQADERPPCERCNP